MTGKQNKNKNKNKNTPLTPQVGNVCDIEHNLIIDFESLYQKYPRKVGKKAGMQKLKKIIKTRDDALRFEKALENFVKVMQLERRAVDKIPYFSTFVNSQWEDFAEISTEQGMKLLSKNAHLRGLFREE